MSGARAVAAILATDLRQRLRTPRFWFLIAGLAALMWWCFPAVDRDYLTVSVGEGMRGRYSSAWIGMVSALMYSSTLSLAGFMGFPWVAMSRRHRHTCSDQVISEPREGVEPSTYALRVRCSAD